MQQFNEYGTVKQEYRKGCLRTDDIEGAQPKSFSKHIWGKVRTDQDNNNNFNLNQSSVYQKNNQNQLNNQISQSQVIQTNSIIQKQPENQQKQYNLGNFVPHNYESQHQQQQQNSNIIAPSINSKSYRNPEFFKNDSALIQQQQQQLQMQQFIDQQNKQQQQQNNNQNNYYSQNHSVDRLYQKIKTQNQNTHNLLNGLPQLEQQQQQNQQSQNLQLQINKNQNEISDRQHRLQEQKLYSLQLSSNNNNNSLINNNNYNGSMTQKNSNSSQQVPVFMYPQGSLSKRAQSIQNQFNLDQQKQLLQNQNEEGMMNKIKQFEHKNDSKLSQFEKQWHLKQRHHFPQPSIHQDQQIITQQKQQQYLNDINNDIQKLQLQQNSYKHSLQQQQSEIQNNSTQNGTQTPDLVQNINNNNSQLNDNQQQQYIQHNGRRVTNSSKSQNYNYNNNNNNIIKKNVILPNFHQQIEKDKVPIDSKRTKEKEGLQDAMENNKLRIFNDPQQPIQQKQRIIRHDMAPYKMPNLYKNQSQIVL